MPLASNGIYEVDFRIQRAGQDLHNIFHYLSTTGVDTNAADLAGAFFNEMTASLSNLLSTGALFQDITVKPLFGLGIEFVLPYTSGEAGIQAGEAMPTFAAVSFKYNRSTRETRSGWKRIGPMSEGNIVGDFFEASYLTTMAAAAIVFGNPLTSGIEADYEPIIFRPAGSAKDVLARYQLPSSVTAINRATTQVSRKRFA